ncbi:MAG: hypothetical protein WAO12_12085, partial [Venatoribacter sp.]
MIAKNKKLQGNSPKTDQALIDLLEELGLTTNGTLLPTPNNMTVGNNSCLSADLATNEIMSYG